jgi:hypothetical protein
VTLRDVDSNNLFDDDDESSTVEEDYDLFPDPEKDIIYQEKSDSLRFYYSRAKTTLSRFYKHESEVFRAIVIAEKRLEDQVASIPECSPVERLAYLRALKVDTKKIFYEVYHGSKETGCVICSMTKNFKTSAGWKTTLNELGTVNFEFGKRWRQSYNTMYTLWAPVHGDGVKPLPRIFTRRMRDGEWSVIRHGDMTNSHFHYHVINNRWRHIIGGYTINAYDTLAAECFRRTSNCIDRFDQKDQPMDVFQPVSTFYSRCTIWGKACLDLRSDLMCDVEIRVEGIDALGLIARRIEAGLFYEKSWCAGIVPYSELFVPSKTKLGAIW